MAFLNLGGAWKTDKEVSQKVVPGSGSNPAILGIWEYLLAVQSITYRAAWSRRMVRRDGGG